MRGIIFQDIFSNLFLGIFVLMVLTLRLSGPPPEPAPRTLACEQSGASNAKKWVTVFATTSPIAPPAEALWSGLANELPVEVPPSVGGTYISVVEDGCVAKCFRCSASQTGATIQSMGGTISVNACPPAQCVGGRP